MLCGKFQSNHLFEKERSLNWFLSESPRELVVTNMWFVFRTDYWILTSLPNLQSNELQWRNIIMLIIPIRLPAHTKRRQGRASLRGHISKLLENCTICDANLRLMVNVSDWVLQKSITEGKVKQQYSTVKQKKLYSWQKTNNLFSVQQYSLLECFSSVSLCSLCNKEESLP